MAIETAAELAQQLANVDAFFAQPEIESGRSYALDVSSKITTAMLEAAAGTVAHGRYARELAENGGAILRVPPTGNGRIWLLKT